MAALACFVGAEVAHDTEAEDNYNPAVNGPSAYNRYTSSMVVPNVSSKISEELFSNAAPASVIIDF